MNIIIHPDFNEVANVGIAEIAVILNDRFGSYEQVTTLEEAEKVCQGPVIMPIMAFAPPQLFLRTKAAKNRASIVARLSVYSKKPEEDKECLRFIRQHTYVPREEMLLDMLPAVRDATFKKDGEETVGDLLTTLGAIKSDKVSYFYNAVTCEGRIVSHCMAVIHEFGEEGNPYCVCTAYFKVEEVK